MYVVLKTVLTDNRPKFCAHFPLEKLQVLEFKPKLTTNYHLKANGQTEQFRCTILASLHQFIAAHPNDWDFYADALAHAYNT